MKYNRDRLVRRIIHDSTSLHTDVHGPKHWLKVAQTGVKLANAEGQDPLFCELFGLLHDCQRLDDGGDEAHGRRAARYAHMIRQMVPLDDADFKKFVYALTWHDTKIHAPNTQIGCCWDADRLDLRRVGKVPHERYLNTDTAKDTARRIK